MKKIDACRICGSKSLVETVDLGIQPWANDFLTLDRVGKEPSYPLVLVNCEQCKLSQLNVTVAKETMFSDHTYLSGMTGTLSAHFGKIAQWFDNTYFSAHNRKRVLDIGSNDGTFLKHFLNLGWSALGVEPAQKPAAISQQSGVQTLHAFYNEECQASIGDSFELINASGVFFHLEELHSVTRGVKAGLASDGIFVVQFLYMKSILQNLAFDQIYHEHLLYYTLETLSGLLSIHDLEIFDAYLDPIHGGSIIASVGHPGKRAKTDRLLSLLESERQSSCNEIETFHEFDKRVKRFKTSELESFYNWKAARKRVFGLGAPVKGNTLLNYLGVRSDAIEVLVEKNALRRGLYAPGSHIPVVVEDEFSDVPDVYYVLAWNFKEEILRRYAPLIERGVHFHFPVHAAKPNEVTR